MARPVTTLTSAIIFSASPAIAFCKTLHALKESLNSTKSNWKLPPQRHAEIFRAAWSAGAAAS